MTTVHTGTRIRYSGDMANHPGRGAVIGFQGRYAVIALEDGRKLHPFAQQIEPASASRARFTVIEGELASPEEIAGLITGCAIAKAQAESARTAVADAPGVYMKKIIAAVDWFHTYHDLPSVFASLNAVSAALDEYPGDRTIGDDVRAFEEHGICSRRVRMCIDGVSSDMPPPHVIDRDPITAEEIYAWALGWSRGGEA
jgi:hypothetical protein